MQKSSRNLVKLSKEIICIPDRENKKITLCLIDRLSKFHKKDRK